ATGGDELTLKRPDGSVLKIPCTSGCISADGRTHSMSVTVDECWPGQWSYTVMSKITNANYSKSFISTSTHFTIPQGCEPPAPVRGGLEVSSENPASRFEIRLSVAQPGRVEAEVVDVLGRTVRTLERGDRQPGVLTLHWDGRDERGGLATPGVYFVRSNAAG